MESSTLTSETILSITENVSNVTRANSEETNSEADTARMIHIVARPLLIIMGTIGEYKL